VADAARCEVTRAFVQRLARRGVRVASVCSGAYVLAEAGLLDGRRATTHWGRTRDFVARYPKVKFEPDQIFTRDDNVWTSAGITAGIDLALAMVTEDHGEEIAQAAARQLVLYHRRSGGQSQFSSLLELKAPNGRFGALLSWARENLDAPLTVEELADRAGMSARHFARAFAAASGGAASGLASRMAARRSVYFHSSMRRCGSPRISKLRNALSRSAATEPLPGSFCFTAAKVSASVCSAAVLVGLTSTFIGSFAGSAYAAASS